MADQGTELFFALSRAFGRSHGLDASASNDGKAQGMQLAAEGAGPEWLAAAERAVRSVIAEKQFFTADDVWATGLPKPQNGRALGPVMSKLAKAGLIRQTGRYVKTAQARSHRAPITLWERLP